MLLFRTEKDRLYSGFTAREKKTWGQKAARLAIVHNDVGNMNNSDKNTIIHGGGRSVGGRGGV